MKVYFDDGEYDTSNPLDMIYIEAKRTSAKCCFRRIAARGSSPDAVNVKSGTRFCLSDQIMCERSSDGLRNKSEY